MVSNAKKFKNCKILSVDYKKMEKIEGVDFLCCDFQKEESKEKILKNSIIKQIY